ncbi:hypothetical protein H7B90_23765 [Cohnella xylanilytica]|uniref:Uncharacterized protein n=1 Tax=Cohnella xylanilytica TaxID=557555 RepID=A0A841U3S7_9BACL|nr:hypothetical protein [Cohnella xylanilytica]MBB6694419.1 hypothetical protein [Cohnella xylanilytica]
MRIWDEDGKEIPFYTYLVEFGGGEDGKIYFDEDFQKFIYQWKNSDWPNVLDYVAPLSAQVITDAADIDRELYEEIMPIIVNAYNRLKDKFKNMNDDYEAKYRRENFRIIK